MSHFAQQASFLFYLNIYTFNMKCQILKGIWETLKMFSKLNKKTPAFQSMLIPCFLKKTDVKKKKASSNFSSNMVLGQAFSWLFQQIRIRQKTEVTKLWGYISLKSYLFVNIIFSLEPYRNYSQMPLTLKKSSWLNLSLTKPTLQINPASTLADLGEIEHQAVRGLFL